MKLIEFIIRIFFSGKDEANLYSEAIAEGIKDTLNELGSSMGLDDK